MRSERELRALCRRIDAMHLDTREIVLAYAIGPNIVDTASVTHSRHVHAALVHTLMRTCRSRASEFAMDYSRRCVSATRSILMQLSQDDTSPDRAARVRAVERWLDSPYTPTPTHVDNLIFVRLEPWGGITVLQVQWSNGAPYLAMELHYTFENDGVLVRSRYVDFLFDDVPHVQLDMPTRDTLRSLDDLRSHVFPYGHPNVSGFYVGGTAPLFDGYLVPKLLLSSYDTGREQNAYRYSACEWVYGL